MVEYMFVLNSENRILTLRCNVPKFNWLYIDEKARHKNLGLHRITVNV